MNVIGNITQPNNTTHVLDGREVRQPSGNENVPELKTGSTIKGTVLSVSDSEGGKVANINIGDSVISAKLQDGVGLREGQTLNFAVKGSGNSGVSITPLYENTSVDQSTLKALTAAGIEINNDTVQMVRDMMEAGLPISKDSLLAMNKNLTAYSNTSISTMVEMKSLNIPINDKNIVQFESYKNYEHQVTGAMESIMDELPNAFSELAASGNSTAAINLYGSVLKLFASGQGEAVNNATESPEGLNAATGNAEAAVAEGEIVKGEVTAKEGGLIQETAAEPDKSMAGTDAARNTAETANSLEAQAQSPRSALSDNFVNSLKNLGISDEAIDKYAAALKEANNPAQADKGNDPSVTQRLEAAQKDLLKELADNFEHSDLSNVVEKASWKNVFSSSDYNKLLKDTISSQWLLKPTDVEKKENVDNLYQRLQNQVKGLTTALNQTIGAENKLSQAANNLQNNLDFMNQLNQMFQYVQLPLHMDGQNAHGDLYVYRNKHKKMTEDGSVSAVLHLDMDNLGPLDVYVKMIDTKVTTNFYVADDSIIDLINDNIHILNERLEKRGYTMSVNLMLHDEMSGQDAAVDEMLNVQKTPILSVNSFDARA